MVEISKKLQFYGLSAAGLVLGGLSVKAGVEFFQHDDIATTAAEQVAVAKPSQQDAAAEHAQSESDKTMYIGGVAIAGGFLTVFTLAAAAKAGYEAEWWFDREPRHRR